MQTLDMTYIHAPATYDFRERSIMYGPVSDMVPSTPIFEMYPLGLTTLCEYLERHGLRARIYNLASMMLHKKNFDVEKNLANLDSRMFGIDLHWMPHCHGSVEVAKILKRLHPTTPVSFGGLSATIFHEDLIKYDCIDYVVRGDSTEEPMRQLVERISRAERTHTPVGDLSDIPNLTWKDASGAIHINPLSWVPDTMDAISLDYAYPMKGVLRHHDMTSYLPMKGWLQYPVTASLTCRGCSRNCATCGGSAYAFKNHFGRRRVAWRDPALLIRDIENVQNHVWGPIFVLNDFLQAGEDYTRRFITGLKGKVQNPIGFEFFGPPPGGDDFYRMLDDNLKSWSVEISAESHDDDVRKAFGKGHYKMAELEETIVDALSHPNCERFDLYFMTGIPKQTAASVREPVGGLVGDPQLGQVRRMRGFHIKRPVQLGLLGHRVLGEALELRLERGHARVDAPRSVDEHVVQAPHLLARLADTRVHARRHAAVDDVVRAFDAVDVQRGVVGRLDHLVGAHVLALVVHDVLPRGQDHALAMLLERARTQAVAVFPGVVEHDRPHI